MRIDAHRDHFKRGTSDEELLTTIGNWHPKPIYLGGDGRILTNAARLNALSEAGIHFVYYVDGYCQLKWPEMVIQTLKSWGPVCSSVRREAKPTIFRVKFKGKIETVRKVADQTGHRTLPRGHQNETHRSA